MPRQRAERAHRAALVTFAQEQVALAYSDPQYALASIANEVDVCGAGLERREAFVLVNCANLSEEDAEAFCTSSVRPCCHCPHLLDGPSDREPTLLDASLGAEGAVRVVALPEEDVAERRKLVTRTWCSSARRAAGVQPLPSGVEHYLCEEHLKLHFAQSLYLRLSLKVRDWLLRGCCLECAYACARELPPGPGSEPAPRLSIHQAAELRSSLAGTMQTLLYPPGVSKEELDAAVFGNEFPATADCLEDRGEDGTRDGRVALPLRGRNWCIDCGCNPAVYVFKQRNNLTSDRLLCTACGVARRIVASRSSAAAGTSSAATAGGSDPGGGSGSGGLGASDLVLLCCLREEMLLRLQLAYPKQSCGGSGSGSAASGQGAGAGAGPSGAAGAAAVAPAAAAAAVAPMQRPGGSGTRACNGRSSNSNRGRNTNGSSNICLVNGDRIVLPGTHAAVAVPGLPPLPRRQQPAAREWYDNNPPTDSVPYFEGALQRCAPHLGSAGASVALTEEDYIYLVHKERLLRLADQKRDQLFELARDHNARGGPVVFVGPMGQVYDPGDILSDMRAAVRTCEEAFRGAQARAAAAEADAGAQERLSEGGGGSSGQGTGTGGGGETMAAAELPLQGPFPWTMGGYEWANATEGPAEAAQVREPGRGAAAAAGPDVQGPTRPAANAPNGLPAQAAAAAAMRAPPSSTDVPGNGGGVGTSNGGTDRDHVYGPVQLCCLDMAHRYEFDLGATPVSVAFEPFTGRGFPEEEINHSHPVTPPQLLRYMRAMLDKYAVQDDPRVVELRAQCAALRAPKRNPQLAQAVAAAAAAAVAAAPPRSSSEQLLDKAEALARSSARRRWRGGVVAAAPVMSQLGKGATTRPHTPGQALLASAAAAAAATGVPGAGVKRSAAAAALPQPGASSKAAATATAKRGPGASNAAAAPRRHGHRRRRYSDSDDNDDDEQQQEEEEDSADDDVSSSVTKDDTRADEPEEDAATRKARKEVHGKGRSNAKDEEAGEDDEGGGDAASDARLPVGLKVPVYPLAADDTTFLASSDLMRLAHRLLVLHGPPWLRDVLQERHSDALDFGTCRPADGGTGVFAHFANMLERPLLATELATISHVDRSQPATLMCFTAPFAVPADLGAALERLKRSLGHGDAHRHAHWLQARNLEDQWRLQHPAAAARMEERQQR
ncbi:hypothetical protein Agub_g1360, partial [Astrephomene gubernaculifera]